MHWGVERRFTQRPEEKDRAAEARFFSGEPGEAGEKTLWLANGKEKSVVAEKICPRMGRETGAS